MGSSCGDGKTDGVHQLRPLLLLLFRRRFGFFALATRAALTAEAAITITTESAAVTIAAEAAISIAAEAAATIVALAVAICFPHHGRGSFLKLLDAHAQIADHVFTDAFLPLDLGDRRRRRVDVEQHEVRLPILVHAVGEGAHAPVFRLGDLAAVLFDDAGHLSGQLLDLLGARVLAREKNMLVKRHGVLSFNVGAAPGVKPFETFGKDSGEIAQKAETRDDGPTGPATSTSPDQVRLLRPSVQAPAGTHGWRALYGFCAPRQGARGKKRQQQGKKKREKKAELKEEKKDEKAVRKPQV